MTEEDAKHLANLRNLNELVYRVCRKASGQNSILREELAHICTLSDLVVDEFVPRDAFHG